MDGVTGFQQQTVARKQLRNDDVTVLTHVKQRQPRHATYLLYTGWLKIKCSTGQNAISR